MSLLHANLADAVLSYLRVSPETPTAAFLDTLMSAYVRRVPWESVSRIVKRSRTADTQHCPRFAEEFWESAIMHGTGGTCFESNYAFFALLRFLGYDGYLTINDMQTSRRCHTAILVNVENAQWLLDAGFPIHRPLRIDGSRTTTIDTPFHTYAAQPQGSSSFEITRTRHPKPYCFTLLNQPVSDADYREATTRDYGADGLFLSQVIITRVVGDYIWRFTARAGAMTLQSFNGNGLYTSHEADDHAVMDVAQRFEMNPDLIEHALHVVA
ncbi:MAG: arylamine N-acetyltransferase [Anaerolineae bacterium]